MADRRPPDINILAPETSRRQIVGMMSRRRVLQGGALGAFAAFVAACGGKSNNSGGGDTSSSTVAADAKIEDGPLLLANWVDYSDPKTYEGYTAEFGPKIKVDGYGSTRSCWPSSAPAARASTSSSRPATPSRR